MFTEKEPGAPRVALVGSPASKQKHPAPARELYTSALFRAAYDYAERTCDAVLIVSAFYGAVAPKAVIRPYDRSLRLYNKWSSPACAYSLTMRRARTGSPRFPWSPGGDRRRHAGSGSNSTVFRQIARRPWA
ncbi:DUF6884 domain-containing protein [Sorangium sp. So ce590]|uniref:DUF6884 domain-containing protein n=1 Tax=Sorangium sp. So ce590 TaxID=3133317 RepID=UPI003F6314B5